LKKVLLAGFCLFLVGLSSCQESPQSESLPPDATQRRSEDWGSEIPLEKAIEAPVLPLEIQALLKAYEGEGLLVNAVPPYTVGLRNGTAIPFDDGLEKDFYLMLEKGDLQDSLSQPYPLGPLEALPEKNADPGRIRNYAFMGALYGSEEAEIRANLEAVAWPFGPNPKTFYVTRIAGAAEALRAVVDELEALGPEFLPYLMDPGGSFNYRRVLGTERLSAHSYGIAVDINVAKSNYWRWVYGAETDNVDYVNQIPYEIVEIFERHGYIWGGKWYHYDTMHFEYRPELLKLAQLRAQE
jgi:peptidoglycan L-alanyl-D-glutamate endopeptidase CwlK